MEIQPIIVNHETRDFSLGPQPHQWPLSLSLHQSCPVAAHGFGHGMDWNHPWNRRNMATTTRLGQRWFEFRWQYGLWTNFGHTSLRWLVGGLFQPTWKILVKLEIFPQNRGENEKYLKPPPRWVSWAWLVLSSNQATSCWMCQKLPKQSVGRYWETPNWKKMKQATVSFHGCLFDVFKRSWTS